MMKKTLVAVVILAIAVLNGLALQAQEGIVQDGEFGIGIGAGHYFGDLNTRAKLNRAKLAGTVFFRKNFGNYIALRVGASLDRKSVV